MSEKGQSLYFKRMGIHWRVSSRHVARSDLYFLKMMLAALLRRDGSQARGAGRLLEKSSSEGATACAVVGLMALDRCPQWLSGR